MKNDSKIPEVKNVTVAVVREKNDPFQDEWKVYLINNNDFPIETTLVVSRGYGEVVDEHLKTSTLRHFLETVPANSSVPVESIDFTVFHLNNEFWVSCFIGHQIYDKRFVFVAGSICEENLTFIKELDKEGVLHS